LNGLYGNPATPSRYTLDSGVEARRAFDNNIIHIYAHGSKSGFTYTDRLGNSVRITNANEMKAFLDGNSTLWKNNQGNDIFIALHSCNTGAMDGIAQMLSNDMLNITFIAPSGELIIDEITGKEEVGLVFTEDNKIKYMESPWNIFKNGEFQSILNGRINLDIDWELKDLPGYNFDNQTMNFLNKAFSAGIPIYIQ